MKPATIDHDMIADAIRKAEAGTTGEIYCVLARSSSSYFFPAAFTLAAVLLGLSLLVVVILDMWWFTVDGFRLAVSQILAYAAALLVILLFPRLRIHLVSKRVRYARAHDNAVKQFLSRNVHLTEARTGVLIFLSLAERYAEIVADSGIDAKVAQADWNHIVADLTSAAADSNLTRGYTDAIAAVGALLARHFPWHEGDRNELDDHLVEI